MPHSNPMTFQGVNANNLVYTTIFLALLIISFTLLGSIVRVDGPPEPGESWKYSDLLAMDPVDAPAPELELIAVYARSSSKYLEIRLDLLDIPPEQDLDFFICLDFLPGGILQEFNLLSSASITNKCEYVLRLTRSGIETMHDHRVTHLNESGIKYSRDTFLDFIVLSIPLRVLPSELSTVQMLVGSIRHGSAEVVDSLGPLLLGAAPPPLSPVILAFHEYFNADTPAQALRSWDGAHSGPNSERHGLKHLLEAAGKYHFPIVLDYLGDNGFFYAVDYLYQSSFLCDLYVNKVVVFGDVFSYIGYAQYFFGETEISATPSGLSKSFLVQLLAILSSQNASQPIFVPIRFSTSSWGIPGSVDPTLHYITQHPWIKPVTNSEENISFPDISYSDISSRNSTSLSADFQITRELNQIGSNRLTEKVNTLLYRYNNSTELPRDLLLQTIGHLIEAARWANNPTIATKCDKDIDWDNNPECIATSKTIFTSYETNGGYLVYAFFLAPNGLHQVIGPSLEALPPIASSQHGSWLEEIDTYPPYSLGAFIDYSFMESYFEYGNLLFVNLDMAIRKLYRVDNSTISVVIEAENDKSYLVPFNMDPWVMTQRNWASNYTIHYLDTSILLSLSNSFTVEIKTDSVSTISSFITPRPLMTFPENPNYSYPAGYFLPFPLTMMQLPASNTIAIEFVLH